jgi:hypothetical protein
MGPLRFLAALAALLALGGCGGGSSGKCSGRLGSTALDGPITETASWHYAKSNTELVLVLRYVNDVLRIESSFGLPQSASPAGSYPLPTTTTSAGRILSWDVKSPLQRPAMIAGTLTLDDMSSARVVGSFEMDQSDGSKLSCSFDLPHDASAE